MASAQRRASRSLARRLCLHAGAAGLMVVLASCVSLSTPGGNRPPADEPPPAVTGTGEDVRILEAEILQLVNRYRRSEGLTPLQSEPLLDQLAREHSMLMALRRRTFGHEEFDERAVRINAELQAQSVSENVAFNDRPLDDAAARIVDGWLESPEHLENIEGAYNRSGVGVARSSDGRWYVTQIFAAVEDPEK